MISRLLKIGKSFGLTSKEPKAVKYSGPKNPSFEEKYNIVIDTAVPSCPPRVQLYETVEIDRVLGSQIDLLKRIKLNLGCPEKMFDDYVMPSIRRYAEFVHLLPASLSHHHSSSGGLFRHGLEVGFAASQLSQVEIFNTGESQEEKRNNETVWRFAAFLAGMCHDIAKPVVDMNVFDESGHHHWNPESESLHVWASENNIKKYHIEWVEGRGNRHVQLTPYALQNIIDKPLRAFLSNHCTEIYQSVLLGVTGKAFEGRLGRIVSQADQRSVESDLQERRVSIGEQTYTLPIDKYLLDAMRRLIRSKKWTVNKPGSLVWLLEPGGLMINWEIGVKDIIKLIDQDKTLGIPRDHKTLADSMVNTGLAVPRPIPEGEGDGKYYRFWKCNIDVESEGKQLNYEFFGLRLEQPEYLITDVLPPAVKANVEGLMMPEVPSNTLTMDDGTLVDESTGEIIDGTSDSPTRDKTQLQGSLDEKQPNVTPVTPSTTDNAQEKESNNSNDPRIVREEEVAATENSKSTNTIQKINSGLNSSLNALMPFGGENNKNITTTVNENNPEPEVPPVKKKAQIKASKQKADRPLIPPGINALVPNIKKTSEDSETKIKPTVETVNTSEVLENDPGVKAREHAQAKVESVLKGQGRAAELVLNEVRRIRDGKQLGETICAFGNKVMILHPQGTESMGDSAEIVKLFKSESLIDMGPTGMLAVQNMNGHSGLIIKDNIATSIIRYFKALELEIEEYVSSSLPIPAVVRKRSRNNKNAKKRIKETKEEIEKAEKAVESESKLNQSSGSIGVVNTKRKNKEKEYPASSKAKMELKRDQNNDFKGKSSTKEKDNVKKSESPGKTYPANINEEMVSELISMIKEGHGRWIGRVETKNGVLWVSETCIDAMAASSLDVKKDDIWIFLQKLVYKKQLKLDTKSGKIGVVL